MNDNNKGWLGVDLSCLKERTGSKKDVVVPGGDYAMVARDIQYGVTVSTKKGKVKIHRVKVEIIEGDYKGTEIEHTCWLTANGKKYADALIATMVISTGTNPNTRNLKEVCNKPFIGDISKTKDKNGEYKNSLWEAKKYTKPIQQVNLAKQPPPTKQPPQPTTKKSPGESYGLDDNLDGAIPENMPQKEDQKKPSVDPWKEDSTEPEETPLMSNPTSTTPDSIDLDDDDPF